MSPTNSSKGRSRARQLRWIDIYRPEDTHIVNLDSVKEFLSELFPTIRISIKPRIDRLVEDPGASAKEFALARMKNPDSSTQDFEPMYGELDYEERVVNGDARPGGVVYDGRLLEEIYSGLVGRRGLEVASIVLTDRLVSTFSHDDLRHHLRTIVCGFPSIVSIPGIVEAPALPREYYLARQRLEAQGCGDLDLRMLKDSFRGRYFDYKDPRTADVLKGLVLQGVLYHLTLRPFCLHKNCRLFNAHWQADLIRSQIKSGGLCRAHQKQLSDLRQDPIINW